MYIEELGRLWSSWDISVNDATFALFRRLKYDLDENADPNNKDLPLMTSATPVITSILVYLVVVAFGLFWHRGKASHPKSSTDKAAPKPKDPWPIRLLMIFHNAFLIVLSTWMAVSAPLEAYRNNYVFWGQTCNPKDKQLAFVNYVFFLSKIYEFVDTFIMLLKGNTNQVSLLHVYHHVSISFIWWIVARTCPGGDAWFGVMLNSGVHSIMYSYYLIAMFKDRLSPAGQKFVQNVLGRNVTRIQMTQFCTLIAQGVYCYMYSPYPPFLSQLNFYYIMTLLALFAHFYVTKFKLLGGKRKAKAA